jgi:spore germination protein GerM
MKNIIKRITLPLFSLLTILACIAPAATATKGPAVSTDTPLPPTATQSPTAGTVNVWVFFTMAADENMTPVPVARTIPQTESHEELLQFALRELLKGPSEAEKDKGLASWFSPATADAVSYVVLDGDYFTIFFQSLNTLIPNASTSAGSQMLLSQLNSTAFQFDFVESVNYTLEGNCDDFWQWLQMDCHIVTRAEWEAG